MSTSNRKIDFLTGWPNPALLPPSQLESAAHTVLSNFDLAKESLKYGEDEGYPPLRQEIAKWLTSFYQPKDAITTDRICITGGASQNLACVLQTFTDPIYTRNVWMVSPTYFLACRIIDDSGFSGRTKGVPEDEEGIDVNYLAKHIAVSERQATEQGNTTPKLKTPYPWRKTYKHIIYAVPTFANPSGRVMSLRRREQLVRVAREYDALLITDDVYDMLQWPAELSENKQYPTTAYLPRLVDVDRYLDGGPTSEWGNAMSNGSFSKIVAPGCRTGWAESAPKLSWALSQCGSSRSGGAPSHLVASMIHQMLANGSLESRIRQDLRPAYEKRYHRMMQSIQARLFPLGVSIIQPGKDVSGGFFIWLILPESLDGTDICKAALDEEKVMITPGARCQVQGDDEGNKETTFKHHIRLCFSYEEFEALDEGIKRIARVIKSKLENPTSTQAGSGASAVWEDLARTK